LQRFRKDRHSYIVSQHSLFLLPIHFFLFYKKKHDQQTFDRILTSFVPNWMSESLIDSPSFLKQYKKENSAWSGPRLSRSWEGIYLIEISAPKNFSILALNLYFSTHCRVRPPHCSSSCSSTSCPTSNMSSFGASVEERVLLRNIKWFYFIIY
jgi:hypothetical protein